jgi:hypothetical protein
VRLAIIVPAVAILAASKPFKSGARVVTTCYPADDYTDRQTAALKDVFHSSGPSVRQFLANTHLVAVADSAIEVMSDSTKCARALKTFNARVDLDTALTRIYLIRAGNFFVGSNPNVHVGREWTEQLVMDKSFVHIATYLR